MSTYDGSKMQALRVTHLICDHGVKLDARLRQRQGHIRTLRKMREHKEFDARAFCVQV